MAGINSWRHNRPLLGSLVLPGAPWCSLVLLGAPWDSHKLGAVWVWAGTCLELGQYLILNQEQDFQFVLMFVCSLCSDHPHGYGNMVELRLLVKDHTTKFQK